MVTISLSNHKGHSHWVSCDVGFGKALEGATTKVFLGLHICGSCTQF
jgi:hypothetical protein